MTAKEYLQQIKKLDIQIRNKRLDLEDIWNRMKGVQAINYEPKEGVSGSPNVKSPQEKYYPLYEQYQKELESLLNESLNKKMEITRLVDSLDNPTYIDLLHRRYFQYENWKKISKGMGFSEPYIYQIHGDALREVKKKIS